MRKRGYVQVEIFFAHPPPSAVDSHEAVDGDRRHIEIGRLAVCHDVARLFLDRRYPDKPHFPGLVMIDMVESEIERGQGRARAALSSLFQPARCRDHRAGPLAHREPPALVLDMVFHDGLARLRTG